MELINEKDETNNINIKTNEKLNEHWEPFANIQDLYQNIKNSMEKDRNQDYNANNDLSFDKVNSLYDLFNDMAQVNSDQKFLNYLDHWITYGEINRVIEVFTRNLMALNLPESSIVAIRLPNSPEQYISILACNRLGFPVVLVNQTYQAAEIQHLLTRTKSNVFIALTNEIVEYKGVLNSETGINFFICVNLGDFLNSTKKRINSKYAKSVFRFFRNSPNMAPPTGEDIYSFSFLITPLKNTDLLDNPSFEEKPLVNLKSPAFIFESFDSHGKEILVIFTHQAILAQILQLSAYFSNLKGNFGFKEYHSFKLAFIQFLPNSSPYGLISGIYLPLLMKTYSLIYSELPETYLPIEKINQISEKDELVKFAVFGNEVVFQRIFNFLTNNDLEASLLDPICLFINTHHPLEREYLQIFSETTKTSIVNSYGRLSFPFISLQVPHILTPDVKSSTYWNSGIFLNGTYGETDESGRLKVCGPQIAYQVKNSIPNRQRFHKKRFELCQKMIDTGDKANNSPSKDINQAETQKKSSSRIYLDVQMNETYLITNQDFKIYKDHLTNLIRSNSIDDTISNISISDQDSQNKGIKISFSSKKNMTYNSEDFIRWCKENLTWYRVPEMVEIEWLKSTPKSKITVNPEVLSKKVEELVKKDEKTNYSYYEEVEVSNYSESELDRDDYLTILRRANTNESTKFKFALSELLRCLAIIKQNPREFLLKYPNRTSDRRSIEQRINYMEEMIKKKGEDPWAEHKNSKKTPKVKISTKAQYRKK